MPDPSPGSRLPGRLVPAVLTALGVMLVTAGLLDITGAAEPPGTPSAAPTEVAVATPPTAGPTLPPLTTLEPSPSPSPTPPPEDPDRVATRLRIAALDIDLPVIEGPPNVVYCDVAMYFKEFSQPGQPRADYLYGHARTGMFLPLLDESKRSNGKRMLGMIVEVWTSDDRVYLYEITEVRRHSTSLADALAAEHDQLWLQTSEGPKGTVPKLQVVAEPLSAGIAEDGDAHPEPDPVRC